MRALRRDAAQAPHGRARDRWLIAHHLIRRLAGVYRSMWCLYGDKSRLSRSTCGQQGSIPRGVNSWNIARSPIGIGFAHFGILLRTPAGWGETNVCAHTQGEYLCAASPELSQGRTGAFSCPVFRKLCRVNREIMKTRNQQVSLILKLTAHYRYSTGPLIRTNFFG